MTTFSTRLIILELLQASLARFLRANGLHLAQEGNIVRICTPNGDVAGDAIVGEPPGGYTLFMRQGEYATSDGTEVRAWWPTERPAWTLIPLDENLQEDAGAAEIGPTLGADEVICDLCNAPVLIRPVPVVDGHALCARCFARTGLRFPGRIAPYTPQALIDALGEPDALAA